MKKITIEDKLFLFVLIVGTIFRFYNYANWSLSNDELSALTRLKYDSFSEMIEKGVRTNDMHPMGVQSFLWSWVHLFGDNVSVVRFPFVMLGVLSIILFYLVCRNFFGKAPALMASAVFAALQFPILYAQLARPYSPGLFFSLLTVYAWTNIVWNKEWKWKDGCLFVLGGVGAMYSHYFSFMFVGIVGLTGLLFVRGKILRNYFLCGILMFLFYIPNFSVFVTQFSIGGLGGPEGWLGAPGRDAVWNYILYCTNNSLSLFLVYIIIVILFITQYNTGKIWTSRRTVALLFFVIPALVAYFYSILKNPVFQYSILLFSFPFLLMLLFSWFKPESWKLLQFIQLLFVFSITAYSTVFAEKFYSTQFFAPFSNVAEKFDEYSNKYKKGGVELTVNVIHPDYINYYMKRINPELQFRQFICNRSSHFIELKTIVDSSNATTFIHGWSNNYHAPETEMIIMDKFPFLVQSDTFFNAGIQVYSKDSLLPTVSKPVFLYDISSDFEKLNWVTDSIFLTDSIKSSGKYSMHIKPEQEFSPGIKASAESLGFMKGSTYELQCKYFAVESLREGKLVVSIERDGEVILWRGVNMSDFPLMSKGWTSFYAGYRLQEEILPTDNVSVYFYNPAKEEFWIDDVSFKVLP